MLLPHEMVSKPSIEIRVRIVREGERGLRGSSRGRRVAIGGGIGRGRSGRGRSGSGRRQGRRQGMERRKGGGGYKERRGYKRRQGVEEAGTSWPQSTDITVHDYRDEGRKRMEGEEDAGEGD